jgi:hypothetical protein
MEYLNWIGEHPFLFVFSLYLVCCALERKPAIVVKNENSESNED